MVLIFLVEGTVEVWFLVVLTRAVFLRILDVVVVVLVEACVHVGVFDLSWNIYNILGDEIVEILVGHGDIGRVEWRRFGVVDSVLHNGGWFPVRLQR